jgi:hypothetical protein
MSIASVQANFARKRKTIALLSKRDFGWRPMKGQKN